jgi:hypothetical protein
MNNQEYVAAIMKMTVAELLAHVINNPTDLTDSYYSEFRKAIHDRYDELTNPNQKEVPHETTVT